MISAKASLCFKVKVKIAGLMRSYIWCRVGAGPRWENKVAVQYGRVIPQHAAIYTGATGVIGRAVSHGESPYFVSLFDDRRMGRIHQRCLC